MMENTTTESKKRRGRPRKAAPKKTAKKKVGPELYKRDENGLLENVDYIFKEDGTVDWKAMLPKEYLYINEDWFVENQQEIPESVEGLEDEQIIVGLAALKEVAKLRGLVSCEHYMVKCENNYAVCKCRVEFLPNYETNGNRLSYEAVANANIYNVSDFFQVFMETIASNRAFSRAVRNALRIDIVSDTELSSPKWTSQSMEGTGIELWRSLAETCKKVKFVEQKDKEGKLLLNDKGESIKDYIDKFDSFKKYLLSRGVTEALEWDTWSDIPNEKCLLYLGALKKREKND